MSAGFDFWTGLARPIRSEGVREMLNIASSVAQVWNACHGNDVPPLFGVDRNWQVVFARWENNTWQWPGGVSPWIYDAESDGAASANRAATPPKDHQQRAARKKPVGADRRPPPTNEPQFVKAARRLGIAVTATADEVRAGMRETMALEGAHPDQGGDPVVAQEITAAKNLLIERIKKVCA